jgi:hypothetical protein
MTKEGHLNKLAIGMATLAVGAFFTVPEALAEDAPWAAEGSPEVYKVLAEDDNMVVTIATWAPGQQDKPHSHYPDRASIYLTDCKLRIFKPDGSHRDANPKAEKAKLRAGKPVASHWAKNMGDEVCKIVFVELKK